MAEALASCGSALSAAVAVRIRKMSGEGKGPIHSLRAGHEQYASVAVCEITPRLSIGTQ